MHNLCKQALDVSAYLSDNFTVIIMKERRLHAGFIINLKYSKELYKALTLPQTDIFLLLTYKIQSTKRKECYYVLLDSDNELVSFLRLTFLSALKFRFLAYLPTA